MIGSPSTNPSTNFIAKLYPMSTETKKPKARVIAFYLPQFHPIPENDKWWGKGFTEWTNVAKAKPLFRGHYQPRIPADLGFYDLRLPEVREQQAQLAREAGIEGFCYWHYWFGNGKQLLERPFNEVLASGKPDFPFCLGWANHSWTTKTWENAKGEYEENIIMEQTYPGEMDDILHFNYLLKAFQDSRYIKVDGKPLLVIWAPMEIPHIESMLNLWRKMAIEAGLKGLHIVGIVQNKVESKNKESLWQKFDMFLRDDWTSRYEAMYQVGLDAVSSRGLFRAEALAVGKLRRLGMEFLKQSLKNHYIVKFKYSSVVKNLYMPSDADERVYPTLLSQWDRSPRSGAQAVIYYDQSPNAFEDSVRDACRLVEKKQNEHKILFLQSWNEWGEGNYVEPDLKFGHGYLDALKNALFH